MGNNAEDPIDKIQSIISEGQNLYYQYFEYKRQFENSQVFGSILKGYGTDFIKKQFGVPKKYTSQFQLTAKIQWEQSEKYQTTFGDYSRWIKDGKEFIGTISEFSKNLKFPGNSKKLLKEFNQLERKVRLDTKLRTAIAIFTGLQDKDLVYNSNLQKKKPKVKKQKKVARKKPKTKGIEKLIEEGTQILFRFETQIRTFIEDTLESYYGRKWWKMGVPSDIRNECKRRMKKDGSSFAFKKSSRALEYSSFPDYRKIIIRGDNWDNIYARFFASQKGLIEGYFVQLEEIRNAVKHNRSNVNSNTIFRLKFFVKEINTAISINKPE